VSDEERDDDVTSEPPPPRPKKKKKKRPDIAVARSAARARLAAEPVPAAAIPSFTTGHLAAALAAGLAVGALGGYAVWGRGAPTDGAVAKDTAAAQAPTRATPTSRPQPPPEPATPVYIPLAAYSPREGPEHAKVTILEFSDFQ
jgi:protein-disulfide isomerase